MKKIFLCIKVLIIGFYLIAANSYSQDMEKVAGTVGKEKMGNDKIVICVYGTMACMPVNIDTNMTVNFQGNETKLIELPFGLYLEAEFTKDNNGAKTLKNIIIDENKTVICFTELKEEQHRKLGELLTIIKGVRTYEINSKSNQVYIEFSSSVIDYKYLENEIKKAGFEIE